MTARYVYVLNEVWPQFTEQVIVSGLKLTLVDAKSDESIRYTLGAAKWYAKHTPELTDRELQVLALTAQGCTAVETGKRISLSGDTVKTYLRRAYRKLGARDRAHAVHLAHLNGLLGGGQ